MMDSTFYSPAASLYTSMNIRDTKLIHTLFLLAQDVDPVRNARMTACVALRGEPMGFGFNQFKSHPMQARFSSNENSIYLHAEIDAIKNTLKRYSTEDIRGATLYVVRAKKNQKRQWLYGIAKPCEGCLKAIQTYGISEVFYTTNGYAYERDERL